MNDDVRNKVIKKMTTERDLRNQMEYALQEAIAEGHAEGHAEGIRLAVRKMLDSGMTAEQVSAIMDIPLSEISAM